MDVQQFLASGESVQFGASVPRGATICIVDSSFNPPNHAHVKLAQIARAEFPESYLVFLLATGNADKPAVPVGELQARVAMMDAMARAEFPHDARACLALTTQARFLEKAQAVHDRCPSARPIFAVGFDTLLRLAEPRYYDRAVAGVLEDFFAVAELVVLTRNADAASKLPDGLRPASEQAAELAAHPLLARHASRIHLHEASDDTDQVSSSRARLSLKEARRCCPAAVADYIEQNNLYGLR